ncbi:hypothetical protein M1D52_10895 [Olivibacter sp. SA151]|uniref:hypothetical protein n=1 Tax=Olivibacter jilunii TaxID=985016 RepID=UPI003F13E92E
MKKILILMFVLALGFTPMGVIAKEVENTVHANSSLVAGSRIADSGGFYTIVFYDTSTSSISAVGIQDLSGQYYSVISYDGFVGYSSHTGGLYSVDFKVTFYHPDFGQNITLRFDGPFNYESIGG